MTRAALPGQAPEPSVGTRAVFRNLGLYTYADGAASEMNQRQPGQPDARGNQEPSIGHLRLAELLAAFSVVTDLGS